MKLVFDIETDGLKATKIWCIVAIDIKTDKVYSFNPDEIEEGIKLLQTADTLIGHNIIGFDIPVINRLKGVNLFENSNIIDTLVLSRLFNPSRDGGHSLERWGFELQFHKDKQPEDFTEYTTDMLMYCIKDVRLNKKLFDHLKIEGKGFSKESIELEHATTKVLSVQRNNGFKFDEKNAIFLLSSLNKRKKEIEEEVLETFKPKLIVDKIVMPHIKKDGKLSKKGLTKKEYERYSNVLPSDIKPFPRQKIQHFNLGSRKQIGEYLQDFGWKPTRFTPTGQPIVDEGTLKKITHIHEASLIAEFLLLQKRIAQVQSWVDAVEEDKRVHGFVMSTGTITGRMAHRFPNMAQIPSVHNPYGIECRSCWIVDSGYKLLGVDASQLELRILAHYMDDKRYINEIINGDIHTTNQELAGLKSRDQAKTFIYALIYGAGDSKIGGIVKGSKAEGRRLRERFLSRTPSFKSLRRRVDRASQRGHLKGLDGRKITIRHQHAALNSLLQGGGAIVMKRGLVILNNKLSKMGLDYKFVANIHDEWQLEVKEDQAHIIGTLAVESLRETAAYYTMRCPLDAEYKIGVNWSETH